MLVGWTLNWILLLGMLQIFLVYACDFATLPGVADTPMIQRELLWAWGLSVLQRILFNEPLLIIISRGLPMLLKSSFCSYVCGDACVDSISQTVEATMSVAKEFISA